mgnify:CR=1 FL=1
MRLPTTLCLLAAVSAGAMLRASAAVERAFAAISDPQWTGEYPHEIQGRRLPTSRFITHLAVHLAYHLGQMDYHRRIVTGVNKSVGALAPSALVDR